MEIPETEHLAEKFIDNLTGALVFMVLTSAVIGVTMTLRTTNDPLLNLFGAGVGAAVGLAVFHACMVYASENREKTYFESEARGDDLAERYNQYPRCGEYIVTRFTDLYSPEGTDGLRLVIDMPGYEYDIDYEFPYNWDEEGSKIVNAFNDRELEEDEIHELVGEPVLVKIKEGTTREFDVYNTNPPSVKIQWLYEDDEIDKEDVDVEAIQENFDIELPWDTNDQEIAEDAIKSEGSVYDVVDSMR